ncbi:hypothetical protein [Aquimarina litoralis]|uniref:hypothetical protein n=1 Tax=Aquimarina litoralis TaxID=584605 RepID=UPI001C57AD87|nr:hypothetical protein [Aquimarina litoralis]MBW1294972.1 hypothetical protein [Aquimarina litoralis]
MKRFLFLIALIFSLFEVYAQNNVAVTIPPNCNRISGKSFRCCGTVIVYWNGTITSTVQTSSNRWQGFTGAMKITFFDSASQPIYEIMTPSYGVNGESSRNDRWSSTIPDWVLNNAKTASAQGVHNSSNRTGKLILSAGVKYFKQQSGNSFDF